MKSEARRSGGEKSVGIWIRVSTEDQARGESPEHHEHRASAYAEAKGWRVREVYHLEAVSGKSVMGHRETERMLEHIRLGHITGLIFSKLARLARNTRELLDFADIFRKHDADLISLGESIDTSTPAGRLFYTMIAAMAQWEREEISERVAASVPIRAKLGKPTAGLPPYGYQWVNKQLVPNPDEIAVRKLIYELFLDCRRKRTVARKLNEMGYRTRNGSRWSDTSVARLIRDPTAKGIHRANFTTRRGLEGRRLKPEDEWVHIAVEPIVSEETWQAANAILDDRRRTGKTPTKRAVHLFSGVTYCGACDGGKKMYVPTKTYKYVCPTCRNKIPKDDLEGVFAEQLKAFFLSPEEIAGHLAEAEEAIQAKEDLLEKLQAERSKVRSSMEKVSQAYYADQLSVQGFGAQYRPLEARLAQIEEEIPRLQGEVDFAKIQFLSRDEVFAKARDLYAGWWDLSFEEKRQVVEAIVERIVVGKGEVEIELCYLPGPLETVAKEQRPHSRTATTSAPSRSSWATPTWPQR